MLTCCMLQGGEGSKKRVHLSLHVGRINAGLNAASVVPGTALPAAVKGVEDHGYTLSLGIKVLPMNEQNHDAPYAYLWPWICGTA